MSAHIHDNTSIHNVYCRLDTAKQSVPDISQALAAECQVQNICRYYNTYCLAFIQVSASHQILSPDSMCLRTY